MQWKISRNTLFFRASASCSNFWMIKNISTQWNTVFWTSASSSRFWMIKNLTCCQGWQGRVCLPYHNTEMRKANYGSKIANWINIRCNYCLILIIFIVNTYEFAYFLFNSGESHEGMQPQLVPPLAEWRSHWAVYHKLLVSGCCTIAFMSAL